MEFSLIERIRRRVDSRADVVLGIGDDAALLQPPPGELLVVTADTLNAGVHFPEGTVPADIGWKTLAVSLSDLAAMGAAPAWCTLSLSLPTADIDWLDAFLDGLLALARIHGIALVGGDTTRGPLSIALTAIGSVPPGQALRRDAAKPGDEIWITGTTGDAAAALAQWRLGESVDERLRERLDRPQPRVPAGLALRGIARACIDVSDGLLADLGHVTDASGVGACLHLDRLPCSEALRDGVDEASRLALQLGGGDDYELCFTAPADAHARVRDALARCGIRGTPIGRIEAGQGVTLLDAQQRRVEAGARGWDHFAGGAT